VWIAYLDETGNTGRDLHSPDQPLHIIGTLLVREDQVRELQTAVREIASGLFPLEYDRPHFELHGAEMFGGTERFDGWEPGDRINAYRTLMSLVAAHDARVIVRGVDKQRLAARYPDPYHPHDIALMFTLEAIERFARAERLRAGDAVRVLAVADENQEIQDAALRDLAMYQEIGTTWGWNPERIDHIIDTMHFVDSRTNWVMQLADCVTFLAGRYARIARGIVPGGASSDAVNEIWTEKVEPTLSAFNIWEP
jgi:hypothetical protein